jgi:hypothetical protein
VRLDEEEAPADLRDDPLEPGVVAALRQPEAGHIAAERTPVAIRRDLELRSHRHWLRLQDRQEPVRRARRRDLQHPRVLQPSEGADEVAAVAIDVPRARLIEQPPVHPRHLEEAWIAVVAEDLLVAEGLHFAEMGEVPVLQE